MGKLESTWIGDFLHRIRRPIDLMDDRKYKLVTVKMNHKGVVLREEKLASNIKSKMYEVKEGDFILSGIDARNGAFGIVPKELDGAIVTNDFWYFDIDEGVVDKHFFLELTSTQWFDEICRKGSDGTTQRIRLQKNKFFNQEIYLPPIEEQGAFISRFKENKQNNDELKAELTHQQTLLKKLRQQILQEAIEGKLTKDWRAENPDIEPASELLKRIQVQKERLIKDKKIKKQKALPPIRDEEKPFKLPGEWIYARPDELVINEPYTLGIGPFGSDLLASDYRTSGTPLIFVKNITNNNFDLNLRFVSQEKSKQLKAHAVKPGYIVITKMGDPPGTATIYQNQNNRQGILTADCIKFGINEFISRKFILFSIMSNITQSQLGVLSKGMGRKKLSLKRFKTILIPIPPLAEQKAIVTKIEKLLSICDQLESQITRNQHHVEQLMQAVLKEAFSQNHKPGEQAEKVAVNA